MVEDKIYSLLDCLNIHVALGNSDEMVSCKLRRRYWVIRNRNSVIAFIDKDTGDIYKAATYQSPAKHARGNVNNADYGLSAFNFGPYGLVHVKYLK